MFDIPKINRPAKALVDGLASIGTATASSELYKMGIRDPLITGAVPHSRGKVVAGPAVTLQFMPKREDLYGDDEYADREKQLHRHALYHIEAGDIVVVDARGDMQSGIFGEMMLTYFAGKGGKGMVIDGVIRDAAKAFKLDIGYWMRDAWRQPEFSHPNGSDAACGKRADRVRRHLCQTGRHHHRRR